MNNDTFPLPTIHELPKLARDIGQIATDAASEAAHRTTAATKEYTHEAVAATKDAAQNLYRSASAKAEHTFVASREYMERNAFPVAIGAFVSGVALGCLIAMKPQARPTFRERFFG